MAVNVSFGMACFCTFSKLNISFLNKKKKNVAHSTLNVLPDLFIPDQTVSHDNDLKKKSKKKTCPKSSERAGGDLSGVPKTATFVISQRAHVSRAKGLSA